MQKISSFLWFNDNAEQAVDFYASVFKDFVKGEPIRYAEGSPGPVGSVMTLPFTIFGQEFVALNGGPIFTFNPSISFVVNCEDQAEVDYYWEKLSQGGQEVQCGWVTDPFGLSWQVVPKALVAILKSGDEGKVQRAMQAVMTMQKLDIAQIIQAAEAA
jgi:predicted 3-demethylubiquinone-9 3-methyltransferase (glyoxalase superfamily)